MSAVPRLGLVTPGWPGHNTANGIATSVYHLAMGLREIGHPPVILALETDGPAPEDIPVVTIPQQDWRIIDKIRARLGDADVPHRHQARMIAAAARTAMATEQMDALILEETQGWSHFVQSALEIPVIVALHGPWVLHKHIQSNGDKHADAQREAREARGFRSAPGLFAPSRNVLDAVEAVADLGDTPREVLFNSMPVRTAQPASEGRGASDILFVGRFDKHKGGDTVLAAFAELHQRHPTARLSFVGPDRGVLKTDGTRQHIQAALEALPAGTQRAVNYLGPRSRSEIDALRASHAIALIASRYENLNYTLLEAMAAGQAIVSTDVGGPAEILRDGKTALMVPADTPVAMAEALGSLLDAPETVQSLGHAAQAELANRFGPAEIAKQTMTFAEKVITRHARR